MWSNYLMHLLWVLLLMLQFYLPCKTHDIKGFTNMLPRNNKKNIKIHVHAHVVEFTLLNCCSEANNSFYIQTRKRTTNTNGKCETTLSCTYAKLWRQWELYQFSLTKWGPGLYLSLGCLGLNPPHKVADVPDEVQKQLWKPCSTTL